MTTTTAPKVTSLKPSEMVEGGALPAQQNLRIKSARYTYFDYGGKAPKTFASKLTLVGEDGQEHIQYYSAGDPSRFGPSQDGRFALMLGTAEGFVKSSNHGILFENLVKFGFPENKLGADLSVIEGLYAFWDTVAEPQRTGLVRAANARPNMILVPTEIYQLPWEPAPTKPVRNQSQTPASQLPAQSTAQSPASPGAPAGQAPAWTPPAPDTATSQGSRPAPDLSSGEFDVQAWEVIGKIAVNGSFTRQEMVGGVFKFKADYPKRDELVQYIFSDQFRALLQRNGYAQTGENITRVAQ